MISKLTTDEQEVVIQGGSNDEVFQMYCSDNTWITRMDKRVAKSPNLFKVIAETEFGKTYEFPKRLLSVRSTIVKRDITDEQRQAMKERLANARNAKTEKEI